MRFGVDAHGWEVVDAHGWEVAAGETDAGGARFDGTGVDAVAPGSIE